MIHKLTHACLCLTCQNCSQKLKSVDNMILELRNPCLTRLNCSQKSTSVDNLIVKLTHTYMPLCHSWKTKTTEMKSMLVVFVSTWLPTKHSLRTSPAYSSWWSARRPPDHWCTTCWLFCRRSCCRFQSRRSSLVTCCSCHVIGCCSPLVCHTCHVHSMPLFGPVYAV